MKCRVEGFQQHAPLNLDADDRTNLCEACRGVAARLRVTGAVRRDLVKFLFPHVEHAGQKIRNLLGLTLCSLGHAHRLGLSVENIAP